MNRRKILIIAIVLALAAITATGSVAYFTAQDKAHNVIASGAVEIAVKEWADEERTEEFPDTPITGVLPGMDVTKIVEVESTGAEAWIRIKAEIAIALTGTGTPDTSLVVLDIDTENWTENDGWYYYKEALKDGAVTKPLFTKVTFSEKMSNEYMDSTVTVDITAQAVQTANNGASALEAAGWPAE